MTLLLNYSNQSFVTSNNKINMVFVFLDENVEIIKEYFNKDNNLPFVQF